MSNKQRIGKVTTRAGDTGHSKLATGRTLGKHTPVFTAIGAVDELNSHVGLLISLLVQDAERTEPERIAQLKAIQQSLFDIGAVLAMEGQFAAPDSEMLEQQIAILNGSLPPLTEFVLPGGSLAAAQCHICRTVTRRAEADLWRLLDATEFPAETALQNAAQYLNRLSDYFFVLARTLNSSHEDQWHGPSRR